MYAHNYIKRSALLLAAVAMLALIPALAPAQSNCLATPLALYPNYSDNMAGWSPNDTASQALNKVAVGDIDGDGNDELVALNTLQDGTVRVEAWHWSYTVWTPMSAFPSQTITANLSGGIPTQVHLADIDGDGQKEIVIYVQGPGSSLDQEQIYKYSLTDVNDISGFNFALLTTSAAAKADGRSYFFKGSPGSTQEFRARIGSDFLELKRFQNGSWVSLPGDGEKTLGSSVLGTCASGDCVAFTDLDGDGITDLLFVNSGGGINYLRSSTAMYFASLGFSDIATGGLSPAFAESWQVGDIDGDGQDEMFFQKGVGQPVSFYYFDRPSRQFIQYPGTPTAVQFSSSAEPYTLRVVPKTIQNLHGVAWIQSGSGGTGSILLGFSNSSGVRSVTFGRPLENSFSQNGELISQGYSGYLRFAVESGGTVLLARGPDGFLNKVENQTAFSLPFVSANTYTTDGYPAYPKTLAYKAAYQEISNLATNNKNADIRSAYKATDEDFATDAKNLSSDSTPNAAPAGVSQQDYSAAYTAVYNQTMDELNALAEVKTFFEASNGVLTNAYLMDNSALGKVTLALKIPADPDITSQAFGILTTALNGLGSLGSVASGLVQLAGTTKEASDLANQLNAAGSTFYLLGTITGDTSTYAAPSAPDFSTGTYDLQNVLANSKLGALAANGCHQVATQSSWDQAKPLNDGVAAGLFSTDALTTAEQIDEQLFELTIWQTLAPTVWSIAPAVQYLSLITFAPPYYGNEVTYPLAYVPLAYGELGYATEIDGLVLENVSTNNFPNITSLEALFGPPPDGLGALPIPTLGDENGWNFSLIATDPFTTIPFDLNAGLFIDQVSAVAQPFASPFTGNPIFEAVSAVSNSTAQLSSVKSVSASAKPRSLAVSASSGSPPSPSGVMQIIQNLSQQVPQTITTDETLRSRLSVYLSVAYQRLLVAKQFTQPPTSAIRQLNDAITRLQMHTRLSPPPPDMEAASQALAQIVAAKNMLLGVCEAGTPGCSTVPGQ